MSSGEESPSARPLGRDAEAFERCIAVGGIALFPADTVYGLACDPDHRFAVERLYLLKRRELDKPSAVMFFNLELAFEALPELGDRTREALSRLLPGGVTLLLPNPLGRFPLACARDPATLGLRVPLVPRLGGVQWPVLQSSANRAGGRDPRRLDEVPELLRAAADLVIDGGELPGTPSTLVDLRRYEETGEFQVVREGLVGEAELQAALHPQFHFEPAGYLEMMRAEVPDYDRLQDELVLASGSGARRILELGTGTGETARRLLDRHRDATLVGVDVTEGMLAVARRLLPASRCDLRVARLEDDLPDGPFDLVASALCIHHLEGRSKADLFERVLRVLRRGGRFVYADVVIPSDPSVARTPWTPGYDHPSPLAEQLAWLRGTGFSDVRATWCAGDLAVVSADAPGADIVAAP